MNTSFKRNLLVGYGISLLLLIISAAASYVSIRNLLTSAGWVNHTNEVIKEVDDIFSILKDAETGQRGYLLTGDELFLEPYYGSNERLQAGFDRLRHLVADNPSQTQDIQHLDALVSKRHLYLASLIELKKNNQEINKDRLVQGKQMMDEARNLVNLIGQREKTLLISRTESMNKFASSTPTLILVASLLSLLVTVISFLRVNADFDKRVKLQQELQDKDKEITDRINIIEGIAQKISSGDFKIRVDDAGKGVLGSLSGSLNKMAQSLDDSFEELSQKEWLQTGVASLNDAMLGEKDLHALTKNIIDFVTEYSGSLAGALYLVNSQEQLQLMSSYALDAVHKKPFLQKGEGFVGQAAESGRILELPELKDSDYTVSYLAGDVKPSTVIAIPVLFNGQVKAVIELASLKAYPPVTHSFFDIAAQNSGIAINTAQSREKVQELLEETQAQGEELQSQHSELENVNAELEAQAEKLQASEEELRVQQEELQQANQELEERSRLLEEKNEMVLERNLEIQAKAEELALSTKYKSEFLANMSHELRTPLNSILLLSRLLSENHEANLSGEQIEYANVIQTSGRGLLTLIDEILDLSKIESGKMELEYTPVNLIELVTEIKSMFGPIATEKNIEFKIELGKDLPTTIETDRLRVDQVLRNLISNALKFTKKGSVTLKTTMLNRQLEFSVIDTGIGIAPEKQETIFEAFQQADGSTRRQFGGTGLGLSISRELARLLGGEISLTSAEGKGSTFSFTVPLSKEAAGLSQKKEIVLPIEKTVTRPLPTADEYLASAIPPSIPDDRELVQAGDKVILIIEDDTAFAKSLLDYTRSNGYKGIVAVRGDEGIELARQFLPMGILLDVQLPVKSGWDVIEELKSDKNTRPIPVHMMSSYEVKTRSLSRGAVDFINKPVAFEKMREMFSKIEMALSNHPKKVLIVEENPKHAQALAFYLQGFDVASEIRNSVEDGIDALKQNEAQCVILDMGIPAQRSYETLEEVKKTPGFENLPIIIFTGKNLSHVEEKKIRQYADTIVIKTAHSYQRILDEVSLFLHLVEENKKTGRNGKYKKMGELTEVLQGKTVLIADDDVRNIFSLTKSLEHYGMNVVSAIDGKEALQQLKAHPGIDLVLMDMMMPEMDGYESTRQIRLLPEFRSLPIIAVTAKAMTGDREKCIAAGASDYITKPVDVDQLVSLLRVWLYE